MFCSRIFLPTPSIVVDGWLGDGARVILVKPMPTSVQHTGIAAHHIVERSLFLVGWVPGLSGIACMSGTVLAAMSGVASMRVTVVDVLSYLIAAAAGAATGASIRPWGATTCGAARAAATDAAMISPWGSSRGAVRAAAAVSI